MIRKSFVYTLQKFAKSDLGINTPRSHAHELLAAYCGFSNQAAMDIQGLLFGVHDSDFGLVIGPSSPQENQIKGIRSCQRRAADLGYSPEQSRLLADQLNKLYQERQLRFIQFEDISDHAGDYETFGEENLNVLRNCADKGRLDAIYALACLYQVEGPPEAREGFWFREREKGVPLSDVQHEFADSYEQGLATFATYRSLLHQAAEKGHAQASYELAEIGGEDAESWYRHSAALGNVNAQAVLGLVYRDAEWLRQAGEGGDRECLYVLADEAAARQDETSIVEVHRWVHLAHLYGYDLTRSVADNDEDFGPVFVLETGIQLPKISDALRKKAEGEAVVVYRRSVF